MEKGFFHSDQGYWQTITDPNEEQRAAYPAGTIEVPLKPSALHKFDGEKWIDPSQEDVDADASQAMRGMRDYLLRSNVDPIVTNPLRWTEMTAEQQQAWADYRRALLDITDQSGFPHDITWPTKPE
jgi:hypothetical protein